MVTEDSQRGGTPRDRTHLSDRSFQAFAERKSGKLQQFPVLIGKGYPHDGDSEQETEEKMVEHQRPAKKHEPNDVQKSLQGRDFALRSDLFAKWNRHRPAYTDLL